MAPNSVLITDLGKFWPTNPTITKAMIRAANQQICIGDYDAKWKAFSVLKKKSRTQQIFFYIPAKYRHALRFLNFKNSCFIRALKIDVGEINLQTESGRKLATARDAMSRNIVFNDAVRESFFSEVRKQFYGNRLSNSQVPSTPMNGPGFRSITMDTWLIEEYLFCAHDPDSCKNLKRTAPYKEDPLNFGVCISRIASTVKLTIPGRLDRMGQRRKSSLLRF